MGKYTIEYDNDTGPDDDGFWEWWSVLESGREIAKCDHEEDAERIVAALIAFGQPAEAP